MCDLSRSKKRFLTSVLKDLNSARLYDAEIILFFLPSLMSDNQCSSLLCKLIASGRGRPLPRKGAGRREHKSSVGESSGEKFMPKSILLIVQEKPVGPGSENSFDEYVKCNILNTNV